MVGLLAILLFLEIFSKVTLFRLYFFYYVLRFSFQILLKEEATGSIRGIKVGRQAPVIIHLLFRRSFIVKANIREARVLKRCLEKYML